MDRASTWPSTNRASDRSFAAQFASAANRAAVQPDPGCGSADPQPVAIRLSSDHGLNPSSLPRAALAAECQRWPSYVRGTRLSSNQTCVDSFGGLLAAGRAQRQDRRLCGRAGRTRGSAQVCARWDAALGNSRTPRSSSCSGRLSISLSMSGSMKSWTRSSAPEQPGWPSIASETSASLARDELRFREYMYSFLQRCARKNVSVIMTQEASELFGLTRLSEFGISHISDNVVLLQISQRRIRSEASHHRLKDPRQWSRPAVSRFEITTAEFTLGGRFLSDQSLL